MGTAADGEEEVYRFILRGLKGRELGRVELAPAAARGTRGGIVGELRNRAAELLLNGGGGGGSDARRDAGGEASTSCASGGLRQRHNQARKFETRVPPAEAARVSLILSNSARELRDGQDDGLSRTETMTVLALVRPSPPAANVRRGDVFKGGGGGGGGGPARADEDDAARLMALPPFDPAEIEPPAFRAAAAFLRDEWNFSDPVLNFMFVILRPWMYAWLAVLVAVGPVAAARDCGPVFIILMLFVFVGINLGTGEPGRVSPYAMLAGGRQLPGQFDGARADTLLRAGQL